MPRRTASRARSLALHWLSGTPQSAGRSQASATIAQICSGVIRAGAPERGASWSRSTTGVPGLAASQRARHWLTHLRHTPIRSAVSPTPNPSAVRTIMRARNARCWGVERRRIKPSNSQRSSTLRTIGKGRPAMLFSSRFRITSSESQHDTRQNPRVTTSANVY